MKSLRDICFQALAPIGSNLPDDTKIWLERIFPKYFVPIKQHENLQLLHKQIDTKCMFYHYIDVYGTWFDRARTGSEELIVWKIVRGTDWGSGYWSRFFLISMLNRFYSFREMRNYMTRLTGDSHMSFDEYMEWLKNDVLIDEQFHLDFAEEQEKFLKK